MLLHSNNIIRIKSTKCGKIIENKTYIYIFSLAVVFSLKQIVIDEYSAYNIVFLRSFQAEHPTD